MAQNSRLLVVDGARIRTSSVRLTPGTSMGLGTEAIAVMKARIPLSALSISMVDGTTNGSIGNKAILTFPARGIIVLGSVMNFTGIVNGAGIVTNGVVKYAMGTVAAVTNDTMGTTQSDLMPILSLTAVLQAASGKKTAGIPVANGFSTGGFIDASAGTTQIFLNVGAADAQSTANTTIVITGEIDIFYIESGV